MMKVFVIGAHGHVGQRLVPKLIDAGHQVIAGMRNEDDFDTLPDSDQVQPVLFDLTDSPSAMERKFKDSGADAIVFSAGAGGGVSADKTILVDLDGAAKSIDAAKAVGISRYVMVSAMGAKNGRSMWPSSGLHIYYVAKHYVDDYLRNSDLNYTILHPSALGDGDGSGKIKVGISDIKDAKQIPRADVARSVVKVLDDVRTVRKDYDISGGNDNINDVL